MNFVWFWPSLEKQPFFFDMRQKVLSNLQCKWQILLETISEGFIYSFDLFDICRICGKHKKSQMSNAESYLTCNHQKGITSQLSKFFWAEEILFGHSNKLPCFWKRERLLENIIIIVSTKLLFLWQKKECSWKNLLFSEKVSFERFVQKWFLNNHFVKTTFAWCLFR